MLDVRALHLAIRVFSVEMLLSRNGKSSWECKEMYYIMSFLRTCSLRTCN